MDWTKALPNAKLNDLLLMTTESLGRLQGRVRLELLESQACVFSNNEPDDSDIEDE
jgi:hypothetical protein